MAVAGTETKQAEQNVKIAIIGKYTQSKAAYKSLHEALCHAGMHLGQRLDICYLDSEVLSIKSLNEIKPDAILVPGGFGERGSSGKLEVIRWARTNAVPFLGICFGMQLAVIEFAQDVLKLKQANSTELDPQTKDPIVCLINELKGIDSDDQVMGGNMRLGAVTDHMVDGSLSCLPNISLSVIDIVMRSTQVTCSWKKRTNRLCKIRANGIY